MVKGSSKGKKPLMRPQMNHDRTDHRSFSIIKVKENWPQKRDHMSASNKPTDSGQHELYPSLVPLKHSETTSRARIAVMLMEYELESMRKATYNVCEPSKQGRQSNATIHGPEQS